MHKAVTNFPVKLGSGGFSTTSVVNFKNSEPNKNFHRILNQLKTCNTPIFEPTHRPS